LALRFPFPLEPLLHPTGQAGQPVLRREAAPLLRSELDAFATAERSVAVVFAVQLDLPASLRKQQRETESRRQQQW